MKAHRPTAAHMGRLAEDLAQDYLTARGLSPVMRNYRTRRGELDLIMRDRDVVVFVEVRYRGAGALVGGLDSIDRHKQGRLVAAAQHFLQQYPAEAQRPCRFDVIAITPAGEGNHVEWISNAITLA